MENVKPIRIPIVRDGVLSPEVYYGDFHHNDGTIHFITNEDKHGRITLLLFTA